MKVIKNANFLPAHFISVEPQRQNECFSRGKLKVFYVGTTADGREFPEDFSARLIKSIGYTPIVSHYSEEKQDFEGHAENQEIYGIVDPLTPVTFETDATTGTKWAICDVIIYDKRPDKTGAIASQIIGHAQSLELDPDSVKYEIVRGKNGAFDHIRFIDGKFIGVSVLGNDQSPAFTGSAFFEKLNPADFRGKEMDITLPDFIKLSWGEKGTLVSDALYAAYGDSYLWIVDCYDRYVVYMAYDAEAGKTLLYKERYTIDGDVVTLEGSRVKVHPSYEEIPEVEPEPTPTPAPSPEMEKEEAPAATEMEKKKKEEEEEIPAPAPAPEKEEEKAPETEEEETPDPETEEEETLAAESIDQDPAQAEASKLSSLDAPEKEQKDATISASVSAALSDSERIELEAYRKKEKENLISQYSDMIPEEELAVLRDKIDDFTKDNLTNQLNTLFVKYSREQQKKTAANMSKGVFWLPPAGTPAHDEKAAYAAEIARLLNK